MFLPSFFFFSRFVYIFGTFSGVFFSRLFFSFFFRVLFVFFFSVFRSIYTKTPARTDRDEVSCCVQSGVYVIPLLTGLQVSRLFFAVFMLLFFPLFFTVFFFLLFPRVVFSQRARKDHDAVSCFNPEVTVHDCKLRVDGISKYLDSVGFRFDHAFGEDDSNQMVGWGLGVGSSVRLANPSPPL